MNIIKLSIKRPTVVVVTFTLFVLFGLLSYSNLSQELFPKINSSAIAVSEAVLAVIEKEKAQHQAQRLDFVVAANSSEFTKEASASVMKDMMIAIA